MRFSRRLTLPKIMIIVALFAIGFALFRDEVIYGRFFPFVWTLMAIVAISPLMFGFMTVGDI